jgi:peptidoglycan/LPS O-acetylase OafA/YrhL
VTILRLVWFKVSGLGFHAVGVFIILSGWTLMQSTARRAESGSVAWGTWYRARFLRLYPMYWVAHLVYLCSPFVARLEPVDSRIVLSLLGLRFIDIQMNFMYLNAAWWYFSMLIQLYLIFPSALLGGAPSRTMEVLVHRVCRGIFRALPVAHRLPTKWLVGARRFRDLSLAGVRSRHVAGNVAYPIKRARGMVSTSWHGIRRRPALLSRGAAALSRPPRLHLRRFCHWYLSLPRNHWHRGSHFAVQWPAQTFGLVGIYSYGLYLIHQPYVIWLGLRIREQPIWMFLLIAIATLAVLSAWGMLLEKATDTLVSKLFPAKKRALT